MSYDPSKCYNNKQLLEHFNSRLKSLNDELIDLSIKEVSFDQQQKIKIIKSNIHANLCLLEVVEKFEKGGRKAPFIA